MSSVAWKTERRPLPAQRQTIQQVSNIMDITAIGGRFGIGLMRIGSWEYKPHKDGSLSVWGKESGITINVTTNRGDFLEVVDKKGNIVVEGGDGNWFWLPVNETPVRLRFKRLPDPGLSQADITKIRKKVTRYLVDDKPYNLDLPDTLAATIKWMEKQLLAIPEPSRRKTSFRFGTTMEYGETYPQISITYEESETDEEVILRVQEDRERARLAQVDERTALKKLKAKYKE